MTTTVFVDECGNTGSDLTNAAQPLFAFAFVFVPAASEAQLFADVAVLKGRHGYEKNADLKSSELLKHGKGFKFVAAVAELLENAGLQIVVALVEKRFQVTAMIVETFIDPTLNALAVAQNEHAVRQGFADKIYEALDDTLVRKFVEASRDGNSNDVRIAGESVATRVALLQWYGAERLARAIHNGVNDFFSFRSEAGDGLAANFDLPPPGVMAFLPSALCVERVLTRDASRGTMVADEDKHLGPLFDQTLSYLRSPEAAVLFSEFGGIRQITALGNRLEMVSHASIGVQLADLAAGVITRYFADRFRGVEPDRGITRAYRHLTACLRLADDHYVAIADRNVRMIDFWPSMAG